MFKILVYMGHSYLTYDRRIVACKNNKYDLGTDVLYIKHYLVDCDFCNMHDWKYWLAGYRKKFRIFLMEHIDAMP